MKVVADFDSKAAHSALDDVITASNAKNIKAKLVAEGANGPTAPR